MTLLDRRSRLSLAPAALSPQLRLAVHALNATMIIALLPLGAAVTTYTVLRGANVRVTGRAMALAGLGLSLAHNPITMSLLHI